MGEHRQVRESVSRAYANVVSAPGPGSGCGPTQKGSLVKLAGYSREELSGLPDDAVVNSFGCGNPLAFAGVGQGEVVLDLGCGAGIDLLLAAKKVGPSGWVIGVDMTDEMIAMAGEVIAASGLANIEVRKGLIEDLPVDSASVDWVISNCVINLSPEKDRVFCEVARVLKPGGCMIVSDVVAQDLLEEVRNVLKLYCPCVAGALSEEAYLDGLRGVGLVDVAVRERIVYDAAQLQGLIDSDSRAFEQNRRCCCGRAGCSPSPEELADECEGLVWSANIFARKPA
jgi:arsenite methyltransferase